VCAWVDQAWIDMLPLSLRQWMDAQTARSSLPAEAGAAG
jgi:hypothetical protein